MKKGAPIFFAIIIFAAIPYRAAADGLEFWYGALSLFCASDVNFQTQTADDMDILFGMGLNVPLLFRWKTASEDGYLYYANDIYFIIEPMVSAEYGFCSNLLRMRTGALFGRLHANIISFGYYAGLSGALAIDFANGAVAAGISPMIGVDMWIFLFCAVRLQLQYDFYSIESYNRFFIKTSMLIRITDS